jgi:CheY-like chemotaxis protein/HPt (histidine-containing phosphotransfer) domain-containing protein
VAEDNVVNQQVVMGFLDRAGHAAVVVGTGNEVLAALDRHDFDIVLMDVQMPELDGLETTAAIRKKERSTGLHVPIVALTAHVVKGDEERCLQAGMDAYVPKPLRARELFSAMEAALGRASPMPEAVPQEPSIDEGRLLERVGGDRKALEELIGLFLEDAPRELTRIREAIDARDTRTLQTAAHSLKGAVSNFAASAATQTAGWLQQMAESEKLDEAAASVAALEGEIGRVCEALSGILSRPPTKP